MLSLMKRLGSGKAGMPGLMAASVLFLFIAAASGHAGESDPGNDNLLSALDLPERPLSLMKYSPVVAAGVRLGMAVVYDDPATRRSGDYLEFYDGEGGLVAVSWFDRFGIQRVAVDRGFVDGEARLAGIFVAVVDDDFIGASVVPC